MRGGSKTRRELVGHHCDTDCSVLVSLSGGPHEWKLPLNVRLSV